MGIAEEVYSSETTSTTSVSPTTESTILTVGPGKLRLNSDWGGASSAASIFFANRDDDDARRAVLGNP